MHPTKRTCTIGITAAALALFASPSTAVLCAEDAVDAVAKHDIVRFTVRRVVDKSQVETETRYLPMDGMYERQEKSDGIVYIFDYPQGWLTRIIPNGKLALVALRPRGIKPNIDWLGEIRSEKTTARQEKLDGRAATVYRLHDNIGSPSTIWIDPQTKLPVRWEFGEGEVWSDFVWDPPIDDPDALFGIVLPEGYAVDRFVVPVSVASPIYDPSAIGPFDLRFADPGRQPQYGRRLLRSVTNRRIKAIDRICTLTAAQKQKLRTAGEGDTQRFLDTVEAVRAKFQTVPADEQLAFLKREASPLRSAFDPASFDENSLFAKTLKTILTADQSAVYERSRVMGGERNDANGRR